MLSWRGVGNQMSDTQAPSEVDLGIGPAVNISPGVSVLSLFRHLNYKPWYALAEFVDNALQSFLSNRDALDGVEGGNAKLVVQIELDSADGGRISIRDNAAGIAEADYQRAFKTAHAPPNANGLCEFGVGMKSAACWFARTWLVRTTALGEDVERLIAFDVESIVRNSRESLSPLVSPVSKNLHYTEVVLDGLHSPLQGRTIGKIKDHLASMYRTFVRDGVLQLKFNSHDLTYEEPTVLIAPYHKSPGGEKRLWRKQVDLDFGRGLRAHGFAALRQTASTSEAGFALFRRGRLIQGSGDEGYRPEFIFKKSNSYTYQRLFGELHLEGFDVTHTKDGFRWEEYELPFLELLEEELNTQPLALLEQAEGYRVHPKSPDLKKGAEVALESTARVIEQEVPPVLQEQVVSAPDPSPPPLALPTPEETTKRTIEVELNDTRWQILLELSNDPGIGEWLTISDHQQKNDEKTETANVRHVAARMSLAHPFMDRFAGADPDRIEPLLRLAAAIALAETAARDAGVQYAGTIRRNVNDLLRRSLSKS